MAGHSLASRLKPGGAVRFGFATAEDDPAIRRLLRESPMAGQIRLTFEREPDYFRGAGLVGGDDQTIVAYENDHLVCMGRATRRECWVNGQSTRTGYLAELRMAASAGGRFGVLRDGYRFFLGQSGDDVAVYFTSIAADNERARRVLERGVRGMPTYTFLAELNTVLIPVRKRVLRTSQLPVEAATKECVPGIVRLLNESARRYQLAAVWTEEKVHSLARHGMGLDRFLLVREGAKLVAAGALWDQRPFRQTVVRGYARSLAVAKPFLNVLAPLLGIPRLPGRGSAVASAYLSPCGFAEGAEEMLPGFVEAFFPLARRTGVEWITVSLPAGDLRLAELRRRFATRVYRSRLYQVARPGEASAVTFGAGVAFLPDVALL